MWHWQDASRHCHHAKSHRTRGKLQICGIQQHDNFPKTVRHGRAKSPKGNGKTIKSTRLIYRIINSRYLSNKQLIISTEKSMEEILSWDEAVGSRLVEMAGENIIYFDENSLNYRLK